MPSAVLDSSALIALLNRESGADRVADILADSFVSTVNCAEVYTKLSEWKISPAAFDDVIAIVPVIVSFDIALARRAGELRALTRHLGLSLGDRACIALAEREGLPALTAERRWASLEIEVAIELIR